MKEVFVRSPFNYDMNKASDEAGLSFVGTESATQQQFAEEVDINTIVRRFGLTGKMPENIGFPEYGDFADVTDYQTALNAVRAADESFLTIPAEVRARFHNDPQELLSFLNDGRNKDEALKLGLISLPPEKPRDVVQAVDELAARFPKAPPL